ncbi:MAG: TIGR03915 family putative DNA repair protein [Finegoldia sp.]|nr:TIGR03915 family putative DNA repair protein [Finegoldia sp.]
MMESLEGFFTVVFDYYKDLFNVEIEEDRDQLSFLDKKYVQSDFSKAKRVEVGIKKESRDFFYDIKTAFKSGLKNKDTIIGRLIKLFFVKGKDVINSTNEYAIAFNRMVKNCRSEAHSLKGLLRFRRIQEDFLFAEYKSNNYILEDLSRHFLERMPGEKFIIFDKNRDKAFISIYGNFEVVGVVKLDIEEADEEKFFKDLWIGFYDAVTIKNRENRKLMIANMPKKYWKYLPEKHR